VKVIHESGSVLILLCELFWASVKEPVTVASRKATKILLIKNPSKWNSIPPKAYTDPLQPSQLYDRMKGLVQKLSETDKSSTDYPIAQISSYKGTARWAF
jgi:hypothetical protein